MRRLAYFGSILILTSALGASELRYYSDEIHYRPDRTDGFVGFDASVRAECDRSPIPVAAKREAPQGCSLCKTYDGLAEDRRKLARIENETRMLEASMKQAEYKNAEAKQMLANASAFAGRFFELEQINRDLKLEIASAERRFSQAGQRPDASPLYAVSDCDGPTIIIPAYKLRIAPYYDAVVNAQGSTLKVTEFLEVQNRSGIDIDADKGIFYTYPLHEHMRRLDFSPWVINKAQRPVATRSKMAFAEDAMFAAAPAAEPKQEIAATRLSGKRYALSNLHLPADGSKVSAAAQTWELPATAERIVYPYLERRVYLTYTFEPKTRILADKWQVKDGESYQEETFGIYEENRYRLYASIDRDIDLERKKDLHSDSESFFTGSKIEDGYTLTFSNRSDERKVVHVTDRIPVSTTDKIEVTDVSLSPSGIRFKQDSEGRLSFAVTLEPKSVEKVHIGFTVKHDKETPVVY